MFAKRLYLCDIFMIFFVCQKIICTFAMCSWVFKTSCKEKNTRGWCIKFATGLNVRITTISSHFFANYMNIFHKIEVQMVIFRCWRGPYPNWFKSYDTIAKKRKKAKITKIRKNITQITSFYKIEKNGKGNICVLCDYFWTN